VSKFTHKQEQQRQRFITESGYPPGSFEGIEKAWWRNPINHDSLRLSTFGYNWLKKNTKLKFTEIELSHALVSKHLIQLERLITEPYYIKTGKLCLLGEQDAIMLHLHAGNLAQYLDNMQNS
jgi:hypothetical protein